ncbi:MAG TPA: TrkA C-terminal domain-containing protein [Microthrixaceae bacterium]|nr:TrkA C-terminal domain-containing protein [Microthrixaceae bacterium]
MLAEAKDTSELMVDLAYAAVYFNDPGMCEEVADLEERLNDLVQDMRAVCILAVRRPAEAESMASVLQVIGAIEGIGNAAIDITRIVTHRLGIPRELIADLSNAEEVSHRVWIREGSHMANRPIASLELTVQTGMRIMAIRRGRSWITEIDGDIVLVPGDVLFLRGSPPGIVRLHELAAAPTWNPPDASSGAALTDLDRAVDVLVEMKNMSEAAVGLAYSALALRDRGLAAEVSHLATRLDEMKDHLQLWVLRASSSDVDPSPLRGLLQLSHVAEELGNQASQMVWLISDDVEFHPVLAMALGEADVVVMRVPVAAASTVVGETLATMQLDTEPGFAILAIRRGGQYLYHPRPFVAFEVGDEVIAEGPYEGRQRLAELFGWHLRDDDDDDSPGELELVPLRGTDGAR